MQITFQSPIGPHGKGISFILGVDVLSSRERLNEVMDNIAFVARRQDAFEQLRLDQNSLFANRKLIVQVKDKRAALVVDRDRMAAEMRARAVPIVVSNRRHRIEAAPQAAPHDISMLASLERDIKDKDEKIFEIEGLIVGCEERIPFWKAILRGEEPLDLDEFATPMAAE